MNYDVTKANKYSGYMCIICLLVLLVNSVLTLRNTDAIVLEVENREASSLAENSVSNILDGTYTDSVEGYLLDRTMFRDEAIKKYFGFLDLSGQVERNGYLRTIDDCILKIPKTDNGNKSDEELDNEVSPSIDSLKILNAACDESDSVLISLQIPHKNDFFRDKYPSYYEYDGAWQDRKQNYIDERIRQVGIKVLDVSETVNEHKDEYLYFKTDNHYTFLCAYYTYCELLDFLDDSSLKVPDYESGEYVRGEKRFVGRYLALYGDSGLINSDYLEYMKWDMPDYTRYDNGELSELPVLDTHAHDFVRFMAGNLANTVIDTNRPQLPSIMYVGYSYTNPLEYLSIYSFDKVHSIDPRYFGGSISEYIKENKPDYVVVVRNDIATNNSENIAVM